MYLRAVSIGSAAAFSLVEPRREVRVSSVFPSAMNLEVAGARYLVTLSGPKGAALPHTVSLGREFASYALPVGEGCGGLATKDSIRLHGIGADVIVDLAGIDRPVPSPLPCITRLGNAYQSCVSWLAGKQALLECDLRIGALLEGRCSYATVGGALCRAALAFAKASCGADSSRTLGGGVASLLGLGRGLTPSGDDFICGFIGAARTMGLQRLVKTTSHEIEARLAMTSVISASLLRCAIDSHWPAPLRACAEALALDDASAALRALEELCSFGHSSGADIASGFLFGLEALFRIP